MDTVQVGEEDALPSIMNVLDGAFLDVDSADVRRRLRRDEVLVAMAGGRIIGVLVLDGPEMTAIAVRPGRRGTGVGRQLIEFAADWIGDGGPLVAEFDEALRPFYAACGFAIHPIDDGRYRGVHRG